ncbi:hypothetical protein SBM3_00161 [Synechococcus phage S-BM3]|nr:hypothetical protein SBM3_00161 [Synechococcus phage S-BM3]
MNDFNQPGANKIGLTPVFKEFVTQLQLDNVCKILGGTLERKLSVNSKGEISRKIIITYIDSKDN